MMLITMLTTGTRGDTQPFMALGLELKRKDTVYELPLQKLTKTS